MEIKNTNTNTNNNNPFRSLLWVDLPSKSTLSSKNGNMLLCRIVRIGFGILFHLASAMIMRSDLSVRLERVSATGHHSLLTSADTHFSVHDYIFPVVVAVVRPTSSPCNSSIRS